MEKQKILWITGLAVVAAAALISMRLQMPRAPVILTYQTSEPPLTEQTEIRTEPADTTAPSQTAETTHTETTTALTQTEPAPVNRDLNTASAEELKRVNGIGDVLAAEIIAYREQLGGFTRRTQLLEISGIGTVLMERIMAEFEIPNELPPEEPEPVQPEPEAPEPVQPEPEESSAEEPEPPPPDPEPEPAGPYDVNTVTREELLTIPDMTEELADEILDMREQLGAYASIYEIMLVEPSGSYFEHVLRAYLYVVGDRYSIQPE